MTIFIVYKTLSFLFVSYTVYYAPNKNFPVIASADHVPCKQRMQLFTRWLVALKLEIYIVSEFCRVWMPLLLVVYVCTF